MEATIKFPKRIDTNFNFINGMPVLIHAETNNLLLVGYCEKGLAEMYKKLKWHKQELFPIDSNLLPKIKAKYGKIQKIEGLMYN